MPIKNRSKTNQNPNKIQFRTHSNEYYKKLAEAFIKREIKQERIRLARESYILTNFSSNKKKNL
jgi:hypothetical protein